MSGLCFLLGLAVLASLVVVRFLPHIENLIRWMLTESEKENPPPADLPPWDNRRVLLTLSEAGDALTLGDLATGVLILGQNGSGKTSGSGRMLGSALLSAGYGGLVCCAKVGDADEFEALARKCGRAGDVLRIGPDSPFRFNPLDYELKRPGKGAGLSFSIDRLLVTVSEQQQKLKGASADPFWTESLKVLLESAITVVKLAHGRVHLAEIDNLISSAPTLPGQLEDEQWKEQSFFAQTLLNLDTEALTSWQHTECERALKYFLQEYPGIPENTRGSILATYQSVAGKFLGPPFGELFFEDSTFTPEQVFAENKLIVLDLSTREWGDAGLLSQSLIKLAFQQACERRDLEKHPVPFVFWVDECQNFLTEYDRVFLATARSQRCIPVYMSQNLPSLIAAVGEEKARSTAQAIAGLFGVKIFHANSCSRTNEYAAGTFAKFYDMIDTVTYGGGRPSISEHFQELYKIHPSEFTLLKTGGPQNRFLTEAVVFVAGRVWNATGDTPLLVTFPQTLL